MTGLRRLWFLNRKCPWKYYFCGSERQIYTSSSLGLDSFISHRKKTLESIPNINAFKGKLRQICDPHSGGLVFLNDLRKMVGIAETDEDIKLLFDLLRKFSTQKEKIMINNYYFGPEVMRLLYFMNKPKEAIMVIEDEELFKYFQQFTTILVFLDLLLENKMYDEVVKFYSYFNATVDLFVNHNNILLIFLAACYKLNTAECFEMAYEAHKKSLVEGSKPPLRNSIMFAALSINHNKPSCAIETFFRENMNGLAENYRFMAFAQAKRFDYILDSIKYVLEEPSFGNFFLTNEAVSFIEKEMRNSEDIMLEFEELKETLLQKSLIVDESLEKLLFEKIHIHTRQGRLSKSRIPNN